MYGLIAKLTAAPGKRDELMTILIDGTRDMPGCFGYTVGIPDTRRTHKNTFFVAVRRLAAN